LYDFGDVKGKNCTYRVPVFFLERNGLTGTRQPHALHRSHFSLNSVQGFTSKLIRSSSNANPIPLLLTGQFQLFRFVRHNCRDSQVGTTDA
jgi:hypothetical protein